MTSESDPAAELGWLLEPPASGELKLHVAVGEGALTPTVELALERLVSALYNQDVAGFVASEGPICPVLSDCKGTFECSPLNRCTTLHRRPCLVDLVCKIAEFR
jgi:hypothetical protein